MLSGIPVFVHNAYFFFTSITVRMTIDKSGDIMYNNGKYSDMEVKI